MPAEINRSRFQTYSTLVGLLYFFNIIVGTGALALPAGFKKVGILFGSLILVTSAFFSYISATFVIESMSIASAITSSRQKREESLSRRSNEDIRNSIRSGSNVFAKQRRMEVSEMADLFLGRPGIILTYVVLSLYLFGDLAIYSTTVPKSMMNIVCSSFINASSLSGDSPCFKNSFITRFTVYRICIFVFVLFCFPMIVIGISGAKKFQLLTTILRWLAFSLMIALTSVQLVVDGPKASPPVVNFEGFGAFFGVSVYAFMCHHSVPGLIAPVSDKSYFCLKLTIVYILVALFYCTLSITGVFAYPFIQDVYTLNFYHDYLTGGTFWFIVDYFLALFPVFALTSSYLIVAVTLSNNIRALISKCCKCLKNQNDDAAYESETLLGSEESDDERPMMSDIHSVDFQPHAQEYTYRSTPPTTIPPALFFWLCSCHAVWNSLSNHLIPIFVVLIPTSISFFTENVLFLASITGSYPGVGVQYLIPALLIMKAKRKLKECSEEENGDLPDRVTEGFASPFSHWLWPPLILCWALVAIAVVTINFFY